MSNITKTRALVIVIICLILSFALCGCDSGREYRDDICIQLKDDQGEIVIKEWSFLLGSGAEVYYKNGSEEVLLGQLTGGDDGFCPFEEGLYSVEVDSNNLTIEWCIYPAKKDEPWDKKTFEIPLN